MTSSSLQTHSQAYLPLSQYLVVPKPSAESWLYLPVQFLHTDMLAGDHLTVLKEAQLYHFAISSSAMHMAWIKFTSGRSQYSSRYAHKAIFKNFPWPINHTQMQLKNIEAKAQHILTLRAQFSPIALVDLYNPLTMPPSLLEAHEALDKAVDDAYCHRRFDSDASRIGFLLSFDRQVNALLLADDEQTFGQPYYTIYKRNMGKMPMHAHASLTAG